MSRRLLNVLAVLSLLPCVIVLAFWLRSYWVKDHLAWQELDRRSPSRLPDRGWIVGSGHGVVVVNELWFGTGAPAEPDWKFTWEQVDAAAWQPPFGGVMAAIGFGYDGSGPGRQGWRGGFVPHWFLAALFAAPFVLRLAAYRRRRRREGLADRVCAACGYDLRATPGRCPECGSVRAATGASG